MQLSDQSKERTSVLGQLMGHQTQQVFLSHPSVHPSWLGVALILI